MPRLLPTLIASLTLFLCVVGASVPAVRKFAAAPKSSHLRRRGPDFTPSDGKHLLVYQDESTFESAARVEFVPKYPTLVLDDVHDHIRDVICSTSSMVVQFYAEDALSTAVESWSRDSDLILFSTHTSCASPGTHGAYMVRYLSSDNFDRTVTFQATQKTMKETTHHVFFDIGKHAIADVGSDIAARQEPTSSVSTSATATLPATTSYNEQTASLSPTVSFDFQPPLPTATVSSGTQDISFSQVDKFILPPDETIIQLFPGAGPLANIHMGCKNCSMAGSLTLEVAGFDVESDSLDQAIDFLDNGFFQFTANQVAAHMQFELDVLPGFSAGGFTANLTKIPLVGIAIGDVITLGPVLELTVPMGIELNSPINFTAGFEFTIPDNSQIILNVSQISGSSQTGFDQTTFNALPFDANADDLSFNLTAGLKPKLTISAGVGDTNLGLGVNGGVGAFIDVPKLVATITSLENVNDNCDGPSDQETSNRAIRVSPSAVFDLGLHWELGVAVAMVDYTRGGEQVLASKTLELQSSCLVFDAKTSSLVPANGSTSNSGSSNSPDSAASSLNTLPSYAMLLLLASFTLVIL